MARPARCAGTRQVVTAYLGAATTELVTVEAVESPAPISADDLRGPDDER